MQNFFLSRGERSKVKATLVNRALILLYENTRKKAANKGFVVKRKATKKSSVDLTYPPSPVSVVGKPSRKCCVGT